MIEASGNPEAMAAAIDVAAFQARLVFVGIETGERSDAMLGQIQSKELRARGIIGSPNVWPAALRFLARAEVNLEPVITASFPLAEATAPWTPRGRPAQHQGADGERVMRAARYHGIKDIRVEDVPSPTPTPRRRRRS